MSIREDLKSQVEAWLNPLEGDDGPSGPDLEYDNAFLELNLAAAGKPETQFDKGTPPDWRSVRAMTEDLFGRTRDLRVAILWLRAALVTEGVAALPAGLHLVAGLLDRLWDSLHPALDEGDAYARANALALLPQVEGVLGDLSHARLVAVKGVGELRLRDAEIALGIAQPREGEASYSREQFTRMLATADESGAGVRDDLVDLKQQIEQLGAVMDQRLGSGSGADLKPLRDLVSRALSLAPAAGGEAAADAGEPAADGAPTGAEPAGARGAGLSGGIATRADAIRAIDMVCEYLERTEPTNPAPLFLRRARSLLERNFLELLKELAPGALDEVARIVGVDPSSVGEQDQ